MNKKSNKITLGNIKTKRDYIYIEDLISAFILAIEKKIDTGFSLFNICSGRGISAEDVVLEISKIKESSIKINVNPDLLRKDEKDVEYGSLEKAKRILGWQPKYSFKKGLEETIKLSK